MQKRGAKVVKSFELSGLGRDKKLLLYLQQKVRRKHS